MKLPRHCSNYRALKAVWKVAVSFVFTIMRYILLLNASSYLRIQAYSTTNDASNEKTGRRTSILDYPQSQWPL